VLLNMTSTRITATAGILETASFAAIAGLGAYLLFRKGRQAWATFRGAPVEDHAHAHDHEHDHAHHGHFHGHGHHNPAVGAACAHDHIALPSDERRGLSGAVATVLSVGLRPCSGALIVLVFALAQGAFWAGVASTFLMAAGTAITVAALAALTLGARDLALRLTRSDSGRAAGIMLGLELTAALFITALGLALLAGAVSA
jgi:ABC-type nickel/cobalt efflux system permease component RcnA